MYFVFSDLAKYFIGKVIFVVVCSIKTGFFFFFLWSALISQYISASLLLWLALGCVRVSRKEKAGIQVCFVEELNEATARWITVFPCLLHLLQVISYME